MRRVYKGNSFHCFYEEGKKKEKSHRDLGGGEGRAFREERKGKVTKNFTQLVKLGQLESGGFGEVARKKAKKSYGLGDYLAKCRKCRPPGRHRGKGWKKKSLKIGK